VARRCLLRVNGHGDETTRVREVQDKHAGGYDRQMGFFDRVLFACGREWVCSQARGEVLGLAAGGWLGQM
jgi:hypothetical protein